METYDSSMYNSIFANVLIKFGEKHYCSRLKEVSYAQPRLHLFDQKYSKNRIIVKVWKHFT